jgi:hypothetical protein
MTTMLSFRSSPILLLRRGCEAAFLAVGLLAGQIAQAELVLDESFNYADGELDGQGGWTISGGTAPATVEAGNLEVSGLPASTGKRIQMDGDGGTFTRGDGAGTLDATINGNAVYFSYILHLTDVDSYTTTYETISEVSIAGNFLCVIQMKDNGNGKVKFATRRAAGGSPTAGSSNPTPYATNAAIFIVGKLEVNNGGNDIAKLWVDPDASTFGAASDPVTDATSTSGGSDPANGAAFGGFRFTAGIGAEVDSLRIGQTWAEVTTAGVALTNAKLAFTTQPSTAVAGATLAPVVVQVQSAGGANLATNDVSVTLTLTAGSGVLSGTLVRNTDGTGEATFNDLSIDTSGPGKRLTATASGLTAAVSSAFTISASSPILQQWTHESDFGESSAAVALDTNYMFVADNEDEFLRLYLRQPGGSCAEPVYTFNARPLLGLDSDNPEVDLEAAVKGGARIYWLGSHSHSTSGNVRPNRYRLFATDVTGTGAGSPPYSLTYAGRYDQLRTDLVAWDRSNGHGLGSNYFGLAASTNAGVLPEAANGFNIEALALAPDGTNAWIGFRAPLVNGFGPTTNGASRTHALIVTLKNLPALVTGSPTAGPGAAQFGPPIRLNLGQRGIRSMDTTGNGQYLIIAGPTGDASSPPVAPLNYRLFSWTGHTNDAPIERSAAFPSGYNPEGAMPPAGPLASNSVVQFVSDDDSSCWRSFTAYAGATILPGPFSLSLVSPENPAQLNLVAPTGFTYTIEYSTALANWSWLRTVNSTGTVTPFTDAGATNPARYYRARY